MTKLSIKAKLTLAFILVIAIMTAIQTTITGNQISEETTRSINQYANTVLESSTLRMEQWISDKIDVAEVSTQAFKYPNMEESYLAMMTQAGQFRVVYAAVDDGRYLLGADVEVPKGFNPKTRAWYIEAKKSDGPHLTQPYMDASSNQLVVTIAKAFSVDGASGVLAADVEISRLVNNAVDLKEPGVMAFITNSKGMIVAHPDQSLTLKSISNITSELTAEKIAELARNSVLVDATVANREVLLTSKKVANTDWFYTILVDKEHVFAAHSTLIAQSIGMGIVQVLIIASIAFMIVKKALLPLTQLTESMKDLAQGNGDLTKRIEVNTKDEIGQLADQVNAFIGKLQGIVKDIAGSSQNIGSQSEISTNLTVQLSDALTAQQNEVSQIATAVHEMSAAAEEVATNARHTADSALSSTEHCDQGKRVIKRNQDSITNLAQQLDNAAKTVGDLEKNAQDINTIISTISNISEQTNLLALNAAIEAARAGEQGRGFAVVADEVRVLSQRTHSSTVEIREMIENLQQNSSAAVESMTRSRDLASSSVEDANDATTALEKITLSIQEISEMASQISNAASEQRTVTDEVSVNIQQVSDISTHLSDESAKSRRLSEDLRQIALCLNEQVNQFKH
ncbi:chemotaxis protein [Vibrio panuliri]|uniref:Chemotaxis protein n=1 Tax=Vibrio panuliri TaxID=1381081 RepID=A0A1Q9HJC6_9VIBR|nr:methyl-accepting chemotaxis protein [Vibrio panuliri]OLQ90396.1 chemotaxis protein [Vibrio panuliri]